MNHMYNVSHSHARTQTHSETFYACAFLSVFVLMCIVVEIIFKDKMTFLFHFSVCAAPTTSVMTTVSMSVAIIMMMMTMVLLSICRYNDRSYSILFLCYVRALLSKCCYMMYYIVQYFVILEICRQE